MICGYSKCGKVFDPPRKAGRQPEFCSPTCTIEGRKERHRKRLTRERTAEKKPWEKTCNHHRNIRRSVEYNHDPNYDNCIYC